MQFRAATEHSLDVLKKQKHGDFCKGEGRETAVADVGAGLCIQRIETSVNGRIIAINVSFVDKHMVHINRRWHRLTV